MRTADRHTAGRWTHLLWGFGAIVVGILLLTWPAMVVHLLAVYWLAGGVIDVFSVLIHRGKGWAWSLLCSAASSGFSPGS